MHRQNIERGEVTFCCDELVGRVAAARERAGPFEGAEGSSERRKFPSGAPLPCSLTASRFTQSFAQEDWTRVSFASRDISTNRCSPEMRYEYKTVVEHICVVGANAQMTLPIQGSVNWQYQEHTCRISCGLGDHRMQFIRCEYQLVHTAHAVSSQSLSRGVMYLNRIQSG